MIVISKMYSFDSAHRLVRTDMPEEWNMQTFGKCFRLHGHTYTLEVAVSGEVNEETGMILNYFDLDKIVKPIVDGELDHQYLNHVPMFKGVLTTAENMVQILGSTIYDLLPFGVNLDQVALSETPKTLALWMAS